MALFENETDKKYSKRQNERMHQSGLRMLLPLVGAHSLSSSVEESV